MHITQTLMLVDMAVLCKTLYKNIANSFTNCSNLSRKKQWF